VKRFEFTIRKTPHGATVTVVTPIGRTRTKRFRNGYASAVLTARKWISEEVDVIRECEKIEGLEPSTIDIKVTE
jgi:hypothetical protein